MPPEITSNAHKHIATQIQCPIILQHISCVGTYHVNAREIPLKHVKLHEITLRACEHNSNLGRCPVILQYNNFIG